jgi:hypothetical protein
VINLPEGSVNGVRLGDDRRAIQRVFGEVPPAKTTEPGTPLRYPNGGDQGPWIIAFDDLAETYRYFDVVFEMRRSGGVGAFVVVAPDATTSRGIAIGDPLEEVSHVYPSSMCGIVNSDTDYEPYPACQLRLAPERYVWFGGDPITSIAVGYVPFGGLDDAASATS